MADEQKDDEKQEAEEEEESNVWNEFLSEQHGKNQQEGHLIVLGTLFPLLPSQTYGHCVNTTHENTQNKGSKGCGKTSLVSQFRKLDDAKFQEKMKAFLIMRYAYVNLYTSGRSG